VGLVQRRIEEQGFSTITLSPMAEVTASAGVPRLAAVEHPLGQTVGRPGDVAGQRAVLLATLEALQTITRPGEMQHLPFVWHEPRGEAIKNSHPHPMPPIVDLLKRKPWLMAKFLRGKLPKPG
jgi:hypothetical protein